MTTYQPTNEDRAAYARTALDGINHLMGPGWADEPTTERVTDLLTNLRHLAELEGGDWHDIVARATVHYVAESSGEACRCADVITSGHLTVCASHRWTIVDLNRYVFQHAIDGGRQRSVDGARLTCDVCGVWEHENHVTSVLAEDNDRLNEDVYVCAGCAQRLDETIVPVSG